MEQNKNNQLQQQKEKKYLYYLLMMSTACIIALILLLFLPKSCARNTSSLPEINIDSETGSDSLHSLDDELIYDASFTDVQNPDYSKIEWEIQTSSPDVYDYIEYSVSSDNSKFTLKYKGADVVNQEGNKFYNKYIFADQIDGQSLVCNPDITFNVNVKYNDGENTRIFSNAEVVIEAYDNSFLLTRDGSGTITYFPYFNYSPNNLTEFCKVCGGSTANFDDFTFTSAQFNTLQGVHFGESWDELEEIGNNFYYWFDFGPHNNINRSTLKCLNFPKNVTKVGDNFCYQFTQRADLFKIPNDFILPENIIEVGDMFLSGFFWNGSMTGTDPIIFPDGFTIPKKIRKVGTNFCNKMFYGIGEFTSTNNELILPDSFELPEELDEVGSNFCARMFYGINFDVPPINLKVPKLSNSFVFDASTNCFCDQFFRESKIKKLNKNFTFNNPNLVDYGNAFNEFFRLCTLLEYGNNEEGTMLSFTDNTTLPFKDWFFQGDTFIVNGVNDESILESVTGKWMSPFVPISIARE